MSEITHKILDKKSIIKQVIIALFIGATLLVSAVLPAEYGIDPLGIGKATGFSKLYVAEESTEKKGDPFVTNEFLSGYYVIDEIEYLYKKPGPLRQRVKLIKREYNAPK